MAVTPSTMLSLGSQAPDFQLPDAVSAETISLESFDDRDALLVMFICNHCPYVQHVREELGRLARDYRPRGLGMVAVNSNDVDAYPQDGPENMKRLAEREGWDFPFVFDETQEVAKKYRAACTPDLFLFDEERKLVYRGQLDDSRPGSSAPVTGRDLRAAIEAVLEGRPVPEEQKPSTGCNIKWKPGNAPEYFAS